MATASASYQINMFRDTTQPLFQHPVVETLQINTPPLVLPDDIAKIEDFTNVCRICASSVNNVINMFGPEGERLGLLTKIRQYLPIKVSAQERLPAGVCGACAGAVLSWHERVRAARLADLVLRRRLGALLAPDPPPSEVPGDYPEGSKRESRGEGRDDPDDPVGSPADRGARSASEDDDVPLANIATKQSVGAYAKLLEALVRFRDHLATDHRPERCYPDSTESERSSGASADEGRPVEEYDDLTHGNMRKDRMDAATRRELSEVRSRCDGKVRFTCGQCGKALGSPHTYLFHKRIHTGERPCVCHVCGKRFRAPGGLQRHLTETHERLRRYSCAVCPKTFVNLQTLKQHFRIHTGERPFECAQCGKRFTQSGSLHAHARTHVDKFPYGCAECGAQFRLRAGLARHRLRHSGERPHACGSCPAAFRQRHELRAHELAHAGLAPHACAACPAAFRQRRALRHHYKRAHPLPLAPPLPPLPPAPLAPPHSHPPYEHAQQY